MWDINYDLKRLVPPTKNGYNFIKTISIYVPYKEIGLKALVRKEQPLPFFYETILKLIDLKFNEIFDISSLLGVEEEILNDVVGEMSRLELIHVYSNTIVLTPKGKEALNNFKKTVIEKEEINRIYVNSITGEIKDLEHTHKKPAYGSPCLSEIIKITEEFITNSFNDFNQHYQKRQEDYEIKGQYSNIKNEIYQIIGKEYEKLCYIEEKALVYQNVRDGDLLYVCENDVENIYGNTLAKQMIDCTGARNLLIPPFKCGKYLNIKFDKNREREENTGKLIQAINANSASVNKNTEEIGEYYFKDRYLFENEYNYILTSIKNIRPSEILISSGNLNEILDDNIISVLGASVGNTQITIISDENEYKIKILKKKVVNQKQNKGNKILWVEHKDISQTDIVLYPQCAINIKYRPIPVGNDYLIQEIAKITFDREKIKEIKDTIFSMK